jgi:hypothetical protein
MITITIEPAGSGKFHAYLGETLLCTSLMPFFSGARRLLELGHSPTEMVRMQHKDSEFVALKPTRLGFAAKLTVRELNSGKSPPTFRPWIAPQFDMGSSRIAPNENSDPEYGEAAE